ncbi:MAG TPA: adenylate/guanylate cyclase domain-containing protein [bacterium]|nr:adenylate/guanylate cyclase domain-containing protein [bacterium]
MAQANDLDLALEQEILRGERLRSYLFSAGMAVSFSSMTLFVLTRPAGLRPPTHIFIIAGVAALYELGRALHLGSRIKRGKRLVPAAAIVNAVVEASIPSLMILLDFRSVPPLVALYLPPAHMYFLMIVLSISSMSFEVCVTTGMVAADEYLGLTLWALRQPAHGDFPATLADFVPLVARSVMFALGGVIAGVITRQFRRQAQRAFLAMKERDRIHDVFGQHVSPQVVGELLRVETAPGEEVRHVCVMFLDIRGFTTFSDGRSPTEVVAYLNTLFEPLVEIVGRHRGIVNKFLGDGFMAIFGAPLSDGADVKHAVDAAREIVVAVERLVAEKKIPETRVGMGLHAGEVVTGTVGSSARKEYTIIGDVVNLASRVESLNKEYGSRILVTEAVRAAAGDLPGIVARGSVEIRGVREPVQVFQLA